MDIIFVKKTVFLSTAGIGWLSIVIDGVICLNGKNGPKLDPSPLPGLLGSKMLADGSSAQRSLAKCPLR